MAQKESRKQSRRVVLLTALSTAQREGIVDSESIGTIMAMYDKGVINYRRLADGSLMLILGKNAGKGPFLAPPIPSDLL